MVIKNFINETDENIRLKLIRKSGLGIIGVDSNNPTLNWGEVELTCCTAAASGDGLVDHAYLTIPQSFISMTVIINGSVVTVEDDGNDPNFYDDLNGHGIFTFYTADTVGCWLLYRWQNTNDYPVTIEIILNITTESGLEGISIVSPQDNSTIIVSDSEDLPGGYRHVTFELGARQLILPELMQPSNTTTAVGLVIESTDNTQNTQQQTLTINGATHNFVYTGENGSDTLYALVEFVEDQGVEVIFSYVHAEEREIHLELRHREVGGISHIKWSVSAVTIAAADVYVLNGYGSVVEFEPLTTVGIGFKEYEWFLYDPIDLEH